MAEKNTGAAKKNFLVVFSHPKGGSFVNALKEAVIRGLKKSNRAAEIRVQDQVDEINVNRTMFNGGTGLLAEGLITRRTLHAGWIVTSWLGLITAALMFLHFGCHWLLFLGMAVGLFLGLEYSFYPFRFSRIGLGEIAAFLGYGVPMMLIGVTSQVDNPAVDQIVSRFRFYLLSLPVSLSVFVTLCLTQIPDTDADGKAGKRSISVLLGRRM